MVDPTNITNFNLTNSQLEEHLLFWVCAAGKNGVTSAKCLEKLLIYLRERYESKGRLSPFNLIKNIDQSLYKLNSGWLSNAMKRNGIGCYNYKSKTFIELSYSGLNLKTCSVDDLEQISGIGPKTARCFLIHSRPNQKYAGLDTHILKFLRDKGYEVPKATPTGKKYRELEAIFVSLAKNAGKDIAEYDLQIWNEYSGNL